MLRANTRWRLRERKSLFTKTSGAQEDPGALRSGLPNVTNAVAEEGLEFWLSDRRRAVLREFDAGRRAANHALQRDPRTLSEAVDYHWRVGGTEGGEGGVEGKAKRAERSETNRTPHKSILFWTRTGGHVGWSTADLCSGTNWQFMGEVAESFFRQC